MTRPALGVIFHPSYSPEALVNYARRAETAGFDEVWLWEDCFLPGALTSAATVLATTQHIRVGIGILPVVVRNPLLIAMELTTLACLYPGRFMPGFGHGLEIWMKQIGAYPKSSLSAVEETVTAVRGLLGGKSVTLQGSYVHLENVKMERVPPQVPPLLIGAIREKSLRLAGRAGDGTILTEMSSPAYVRWAHEQIAAGMAESGCTANQMVVYTLCKVNPDGASARQFARQALASRLAWSGAHLAPLGIAAEAQALLREGGVDGAARSMPEDWVDSLSASGTPEQCVTALKRLEDAGANSIVLQPIDADPDALDEYIQFIIPHLK